MTLIFLTTFFFLSLAHHLQLCSAERSLEKPSGAAGEQVPVSYLDSSRDQQPVVQIEKKKAITQMEMGFIKACNLATDVCLCYAN